MIVSEVLGHSGVSITLYVYSHVIPRLGARRLRRWRTCCATIPALAGKKPSDP
jgi:hypothetical protein